MAKKKNRNNRNNRPVQQPTAKTVAPATPVVEATPVTVDDVKVSVSQEEFEANKEALFAQFEKEIAEWEELKATAEKSGTEAQKALTAIEEKLQELNTQKSLLEKEITSLQEKFDTADETVQNATKEADSVKAEADKYSEEVRKSAYEEALKIKSDAESSAKDAWKVQLEKLEKEHQGISEREGKLAETKREIEKEKRRIEDDKEAIEELKEDLQNRKARYDAANPAKVSALETELNDEKNKYEALLTRYQTLSKHNEELQVLMDTVKTEIQEADGKIVIASMNEVVSALRELRDKHERLSAIYTRYPDDASINALEDKAQRSDELERENEALKLDRNRYQKEATATRNAKKELEVIKQEVEATNALNEHLLQELESHKTALESRTGDTCPSLSKVDTEAESGDFKADISKRMQRTSLKTLPEVVSHVKNYAGSRPLKKQLYYTDNDIRAFLAGMSVSRLMILQGMSGTGKSSLPRIFSEAISGFNRLIPVESSWRDRNELLGYYNDFNKKFNAKSFTIELYRSSKENCRELPTFIVLDEMNLARIEYYFSDFLAILQEPDHDKWLIELVSSDMRTLPMELPESVKVRMQKEDPTIYSIWEKIERSRQGDLRAETSDEDKELLTSYLAKLGQLTGAKNLIDGRKIRVTDNIWFIGTANRDESTFEISDKVYDRAQVVSLNKKGVSEGKYAKTTEKYISVSDLKKLFADAIKTNKTRESVETRLNKLDNVLIDKFDISFGNRIVTQTIDFVAVFVAAGGTLEDALDYQISTKILRKVIATDDEEALIELGDVVIDYPETTRLIEKRLRELR